MSGFNFLDRGLERTTLLVPGWATDYRIFDDLDLETNYLVPAEQSPFNFNRDLLEAIELYKLGRISVIGWSMGAFLACGFMSEYSDRVYDVTLVSARQRYEKEKLEGIRAYLKKNRTGFLRKFYRDCFSDSERPHFNRFKDNLLKDYLDRMSLKILSEGLDYLSDSEIRPQALQDARVRFVHGREDKIAPIEEVLRLREELQGAALVVINDSGHIPFFNPRFKEICSEEYVSHR